MHDKSLPVVCFGRPLPNGSLYPLDDGSYQVYYKGHKVARICRKQDALQAICDWFEANGYRKL